ncbi:MAG: ClpX C4-type zinc finger protein [Methylocella sp.]
MSNQSDFSVATLISLLWGKLMMTGRYDAAAALGAFASLMSKGDANLTDVLESAPGLIEKAMSEQASGTKPTTGRGLHCDFCGKSPPEVKVIQGPSAVICNECVHTASEVFDRE